jgi:hypothetical protein
MSAHWMKPQQRFRRSLVVRLSLLLGFFAVAAGVAPPAHAAMSLTITTCSDDTQLQAAVSTANGANAGDTITFACSGDIVLTSTLTISGSMTLDGSGQRVILDGQQQRQALSVSGGVFLTLKTLTIANGFVSGDGGGIENHGTLTISNSVFSGNAAFGNGGGVENTGTLRVSESTFSGNSVAPGFGGGGVENTGTLTISKSAFSGNTASGGGGIVSSGTASISDSTFSGNSTNTGGGVENNGGTLSISDSSFAGNFAFVGGGIQTSGTIHISRSIVAGNTGGDCNGALTDQGYNLSSDSTCGFTGAGSVQNIDPKLDPKGLQDNGGPTQTIGLQPDSPAVDRIRLGGGCPGGAATDQRGVPRPQGPACDVGPFEMTTADGLRVMIHVVDSFQLAKGIHTSLDSQLSAVLAALQANRTTQACGALTSFIRSVSAQSGNQLTTAQATQLLTEAAVIKTRLGC